MLTIFVKNERCTRHCAGVKFDFQVSNRLTHGMHFSPILPVSRLRNQWPFCIKEGGRRSCRGIEETIFQPFSNRIRKKKIMGDVNSNLRGPSQCVDGSDIVCLIGPENPFREELLESTDPGRSVICHLSLHSNERQLKSNSNLNMLRVMTLSALSS